MGLGSNLVIFVTPFCEQYFYSNEMSVNSERHLFCEFWTKCLEYLLFFFEVISRIFY